MEHPHPVENPAKRAKVSPSVTDEDRKGPEEQEPSFLTPPTSASVEAPLPSPDGTLLADRLVPRGGSANWPDSPAAVNDPRTATDNKAGDDEYRIRKLLQEEAGFDVEDPKNVTKRTGYLSWDDYFMAVAFLSAKRSKDPHQQVGACIVDTENRIVGIGYNGFPRGCPDDCLPWNAVRQEEKPANVLHTRDPYMTHAEVNAILNKCSADVAGSRMYVAHFPCNECAKIIIQSRIAEVVYMEDSNPENDTYRASRIMFSMAGVKARQHTPKECSVRLDFGAPDQEMGQACCLSVNKEAKAKEEQARYKDLLLREAAYDPTTAQSMKRQDCLSWDEYFMAMAFLSAQRSKDPNTQVGACIVDANKCIIGIGYNGFPRGCSDEHLPWARSADSDLHKKYPYVCHAEVNAILNKCSADVKGASIYVALFPCNDCAKVIIQAGIREVVFLSDQYHNTDSVRASRIMFEMAGVKLRYFRPQNRFMEISIQDESGDELPN